MPFARIRVDNRFRLDHRNGLTSSRDGPAPPLASDPPAELNRSVGRGESNAPGRLDDDDRRDSPSKPVLDEGDGLRPLTKPRLLLDTRRFGWLGSWPDVERSREIWGCCAGLLGPKLRDDDMDEVSDGLGVTAGDVGRLGVEPDGSETSS